MNEFRVNPDAAYPRARQRMIEQQLRRRGIRDERVLAAMAEIPRESFVRPQDEAFAYDDRALPIGAGQTISQPYMVALMTELLDVREDHHVLEIGTGSGYQAAILAKLAGHLYTVERLGELSRQARRLLQQLGLVNITYLVGDGSLGWPEFAPYDRIITTAAAPNVPAPLLEQLTEAGKLVIPVGGPDEQVLTVVEKQGARLIERPSVACRFVPLVGKEGWPESSN